MSQGMTDDCKTINKINRHGFSGRTGTGKIEP